MDGYVSKRTNPAQFYDYDELLAILATEAKRPTIEEKRFLKLIDYTLAEKWLEEIDIETDPFSDKDDIKQVLEKSNKSKEFVGELTLKKINSGDTDFKKLIEKITEYLGEDDKLEKSDVIFVFGSKSAGRILRAVALWKAGWAPKIWISGGSPIYERNEPEALTLKKIALESGVPEECIFTEPDSITIADNCRKGLNLMDERQIKFQKMILVTSWFTQKRAWMTMEKYLPVNTKLFKTKAKMEADNQLSPTKWYESDYGINIVFNEFLKMRVHDGLVMGRLI